ncbi:MAG: hypothetical protein KGI67_08140 [Pseudomonadota bacterium]|nr:hypothetical protein [Pseudomonadota bacterium]
MRKVNDPVMDYLEMWVWRIVMLIGLSLLQALVLWLLLWNQLDQASIRSSLVLLFSAWPFNTHTLQGWIEIGLLWIGIGNTVNLYQWIGKWWRRRADILHRRGGRFIDERRD